MKVENWCALTVVAAEANVSASELAEMMRDHDVSEVVIIRQAGTLVLPIGIVTDRDLVLRALAGGTDARTLTAADVMSRQLLAVFAQEDLDVALGEMRARGVDRAPVVDDDGALMGMLMLPEVLTTIASMTLDLFPRCQSSRTQALEAMPSMQQEWFSGAHHSAKVTPISKVGRDGRRRS